MPHLLHQCWSLWLFVDIGDWCLNLLIRSLAIIWQTIWIVCRLDSMFDYRTLVLYLLQLQRNLVLVRKQIFFYFIPLSYMLMPLGCLRLVVTFYFVSSSGQWPYKETTGWRHTIQCPWNCWIEYPIHIHYLSSRSISNTEY